MRQFLIWNDFATYRGAGFYSRPHSHFFIQISLPDSGSVTLHARDGSQRTFRAACIPSAVNHEMQQVEGDMTLLYLHPLTMGLRLFGHRGLSAHDTIFEVADLFTDTVKNQIAEILRAADKEARLHILNLLTAKIPKSPAPVIDERIAASIHNAEPEDFVLERLARQAGLSSSRFRHLFRQQTGVTFSAYRLWLKTKKAVHHLAGRPNLNTAAYEGRFADLAHFSRIFRRSFGVQPSDFTKKDLPFSALFFAE